MSKRKPILGERLFSLNIGNMARRGVLQVLTPVNVSKVGRKYFTCTTEGKYGFDQEYVVETWREHTNYCENSKLYESEQAWLDEQEENKLCVSIVRAFEHGENRNHLSLAALRQIAALITPAPTT